MQMANRVYLDDEGNAHIELGRKKAFSGLLPELRTLITWLFRAATLAGAAVQLRYQVLGR